MSAATAAMLAGALAADLYVSPSGADTNKGGADAPLASLAAAQKAAQAFAGKESVTVHVADGIYYLPEALVFTAADSGTAELPISYTAQNEGGAILSGGSLLSLEWSEYKDGIYQASVPAGLEIDQLFINGTNQRMARYPNYDPAKKAKPYQGYSADAFSKERAERWSDPAGGYIHALHSHKWGGYHYQITGKDAEGEVTYEGGWQNNRQMGMHKDYRIVENIFEELDTEHEWFHNRKTNTLYFKPEAGLDLASAKVEVVRLRHLVEFNGSEEAPVTNLTFKGFVVRHASRTFMDCKEPLLRSDWAIYRGGAFFLTGTESISILDCEFDQVGGNAIFVNNYNRNTLVKGCHIHHTGASGICFVGDPNAVHNPLFEYAEKNKLADISLELGPKTNNYPADSTVEDCLIHKIGITERQPAGVQISMAKGITIRDTSIYDTARAGINVSEGTWGGHLIERVDVFDTVLETSDHGSFNSWGRDRYWKCANDRELAANPKLPFLDAIETTVIRDSRWRCDHGWDIDLDDGSTNYDIYNNLMLNGGLKLREGFRRYAWNNITVNSTLSPHVWYQNSGDKVYNNIFMAPYRGVNVPTATVKGDMVDKNIMFRGELAREHGWDENSIEADPLFVDPTTGDYRVQDGSPALDLGFKNFPMGDENFGVRKPSLRAIARTPVLPALRQSVAKIRKPKKAVAVSADVIWQGAKLHSLTGMEFSAYGVSDEDAGVVLQNLAPTAQAAKAGLKTGDVIQAINGQKVKNVNQFYRAMASAKSAQITLKVVRSQQAQEMQIPHNSVTVVESTDQATALKELPLPAATKAKVQTSAGTVEEALKTLTDGALSDKYGALFPNKVTNGIYKIDLGASKPVAAVNTWTSAGGDRSHQKLMIYASNADKDPGWDLTKFDHLGTVDTTGQNAKAVQASSVRALSGTALGNYRWILWAVKPISQNGGGENSSVKELSVTLAN